MGHWSMHIEGHGIHDNNGDDRDADTMLRVFAGKLAGAGHAVHLVTFTSGSAKELLNADDTTPLEPAEGDTDRLRYRPRT